MTDDEAREKQVADSLRALSLLARYGGAVLLLLAAWAMLS